jgi:hypothetical protein
MKELDNLFEHANQVEVSLRWYYDIGEDQFQQFMRLTQEHHTLQPAVDEALQMAHWYGPSYLVPIDHVPRSPKAEISESDPGYSKEVP